ncbi:FAD-binding oxidoreductase [Halobacteriales archaeon QH_3_68_24]|nr:MAG: FAD-binding oxidoreductase [Halobacteriales archaeon QH_3_68_24]
MSAPERVAVVGGGVVGCAVARALAPDHDVVVLEKGQVAGEATALSAGLVTMTPSYHDVTAVPDRANAFFRSYDGTGEFRYTERPSVEFVPEGRADAARRRVERLQADGVEVSFVDPDAIAERYPLVAADRFAGGVEFAESGWLDPHTFATTLHDDAVDRGAEVHTGTAVESVVVRDGAVAGVETAEGTVGTDAVVAAAGWWTPDLLEGVAPVPVRPYRTQCIVVDPGESFADAPIGWHPDEHAYFRPEHNGDLLVGGWSFAEDDPESASGNADEEFRQHVAELLPEWFEDMPDPRLVNGWAGIDGATPDTRPIVDAPGGMAGGQPASDELHDVPENLVVATGFHGRGVMTAPVAADAVRAIVTGEDAPFPIETFALDRFDDYSREFEFTSVSS